jgi:hypothetical protein
VNPDDDPRGENKTKQLIKKGSDQTRTLYHYEVATKERKYRIQSANAPVKAPSEKALAPTKTPSVVTAHVTPPTPLSYSLPQICLQSSILHYGLHAELLAPVFSRVNGQQASIKNPSTRAISSSWNIYNWINLLWNRLVALQALLLKLCDIFYNVTSADIPDLRTDCTTHSGTRQLAKFALIVRSRVYNISLARSSL